MCLSWKYDLRNQDGSWERRRLAGHYEFVAHLYPRTFPKSANAKIPIKLGIGASNFSSGIPSSFKFGGSGKASGGGQGPK